LVSRKFVGAAGPPDPPPPPPDPLPEPVIVTVALEGVASVAPPVGLDSATAKLLLPENGVALLIATDIVFDAASPSAQFSVPLAAVKSVPDTAVPFAVAYPTLTAPLEPPVRFTVTLTAPALCITASLAAESCTLPTALTASPLIDTMALPGLASVAPPPAPDSVTVKDFAPANGVALLIGIDTVFVAASPSAQFSVPLAAVKSVPDTAVPLTVAYPTLTAPAEPPLRVTLTATLPAPCDTAKLAADNSSDPTAADPSPLIVTLALPGLAIVAPALGWDSATVKDLLPVNGVVFMIATEKVFGLASPSAQLNVPLVAA